MAQRTTQRPSNYAFSQQLHLTNPMAQRVLALATREGISPMQAVLKCLEDHLPRVQVKIVGADGKPVEQQTAAKLDTRSFTIDLPLEANRRDFAPSTPHKPAVDDALVMLHAVAANQPIGQDFTLSDLFRDPATWGGFPQWFRRAVRKRFLQEMLSLYEGVDQARFRIFRGHPATRYMRQR